MHIQSNLKLLNFEFSCLCYAQLEKIFELYCKPIDRYQPEEGKSHFHYQGLNINYVICLKFSTNMLWGTSLAFNRANENFRNMKI